MSELEGIIPQQHLLPKSEGQSKRIGSRHNQLDEKKMQYIIGMRKALCKDNICFQDGSLNLKYFNVKKGHYWSQKENKKLIAGVIAHGATSYKEIKSNYLQDWTETEIRLRICKLLRFYDLKAYEDQRFNSEEQIFAEAKKNREEAERLDKEQLEQMREKCQKQSDKEKLLKPKEPKLVGGIYFNPPPLSVINKEHDGTSGINVFSNFFNKGEKVKTETISTKQIKTDC